MLSFPRPGAPEGASPQPNEQKGTARAPAVASQVTVESASRLGEDLITRWVGSGGPPTIPEGRRDEVVATLTRCMVSDSVLAAYVGSLEAGWDAHGDREPMTGYPAGDMPDLHRDGFAPLSDAALADVAVCPSAVRAAWEDLTTPPSRVEDFREAGDWLHKALDDEDALKKK